MCMTNKLRNDGVGWDEHDEHFSDTRFLLMNERRKKTLHFPFDCLNSASHVVTYLEIDAVLSGTIRRSLRQSLYEIDSTLQPQL